LGTQRRPAGFYEHAMYQKRSKLNVVDKDSIAFKEMSTNKMKASTFHYPNRKNALKISQQLSRSCITGSNA
jgi:hypothetical protein